MTLLDLALLMGDFLLLFFKLANELVKLLLEELVL
jgi:hypothetical protein